MAEIAEQIQAARELHQSGKLREAIEGYQQILEAEPHNARVLAAMGQIWSTRLLYGRAVECLEKAVESEPEQFIYSYLLATPLRRMGRLEDSVAALSRAIGMQPDHWESHLEKIWALDRMGRDADAAREDLAAALPANAEDLEQLCDELTAHRKKAALACITRANELDATSASRQSKQGHLERELGIFEAAFASYQRAIELDPQADGAHAGLAGVCERLGRSEDARWYAASALGQDPDDIGLQLALARLDRKDGDLPSAIKRLRRLKGDPRIDSKWTYGSVCVELGLALDTSGDAEGAFANIAEGKVVLSERKAARRYPRGGLAAWIRHVRDRTEKLDVDSWAKDVVAPEASQDAPIFIVGFPGSGSSTITRIVTRAPAMRSSDGAKWLPETIRGMRDLAAGSESYPGVLEDLNGEQIAALRTHYFGAGESDDARDGSVREASRVVDTLEMNITRLATIARLFPGAKVIVALRDPRDCCLECLFGLDEADPTTVHFFNLDSTTALYAQVMDLYIASRDRLGLDLAEVRVEDLAADPGAIARRIIEFIGEPWDDAILGEMGSDPGSRWRRYAYRLEPYGDRLDRFVEEFGYGPA